MRHISVAVPVPFLDLLTYRVPAHLGVALVGARVRVPLGPRVVTGCVVREHDDSTSAAKVEGIKDVIEVLDDEPFLPPTLVGLCEWVADYYMSGIGDAIGMAFPPGARVQTSGFKMRRVVAITAAGRERLVAAASMDRPALTPKQLRTLEVLAIAEGPLGLTELRDRGLSQAVVARVAALELAAVTLEAVERDPCGHAVSACRPATARSLTDEQSSALDELTALAETSAFRVALIHGVTGSGKTELYLRLAEHVRRMGRGVILLVPEIGLTPSMAALVRAAFGGRVAIQHSALSAGERHDQWQRIRRGEVDVVVGTRSAVFAPMPRLGLLIVDEEHDASYKQDETPRYHGRDVAVLRASREGAMVVLGSATPSLETYQHAVSGKYVRVVLANRVLDRPLPGVRLVNMRDEYADEGPDVVLSRALTTAIEHRLHEGEQVLILLNRRGYATSVFCRQCGDTFECPNCSLSLTVHTARHGWRARCHYCNYATMVPAQCRKCAAPYLEQAGFGTERVEQCVRERFPAARVARMDRDSVRRKGALTSLLRQFADGELDVLVGTQMIAKGHDFPRVTLVGVISADVGLGVADFRAGERTFQLLTQVAGRAGRGERLGEAIVQTLVPEHYSVELACRQDYAAFFEREMTFRRGMQYPPSVALISAVVRGRTVDEATRTADALAAHLRPHLSGASFVLLGPAPAPLARLRGEHRVQIFLKGTNRAAMREAFRAALVAMPDARRRITVDVDPVNVL